MAKVNLKKAVSGALERTSPELSLVVIVAFSVLLLSTTYFTFALTPAQFAGKSEVQEYEKSVGEVSEMDDWTRTGFYWANNLGVAGVYVVGTPTYLGFNSVVANNYRMGMSLAYWYYYPIDNSTTLGGRGMMASAAQYFVHGLLELTGFYMIAAASLRVGWNLWRGVGHMSAVARRKKRRSWGLSKWERREILRHKRPIKLLLGDFTVILAIGALLIFLAGPIEAYVTPELSYGFYVAPVLAVIYLVAVGLVYAAIAAQGFSAMRAKVRLVWKEVRLAFRSRRWRAQAPFLMFLMFFILMLVRVLF